MEHGVSARILGDVIVHSPPKNWGLSPGAAALVSTFGPKKGGRCKEDKFEENA